MSKPSSVRPVHVLGIVAAIIIAILVLGPDIASQRGMNPSSFGYGPYGARGFYQTMERLGWPVERRLTTFRDTLAADATYLVLSPPIPPGALETSQLLAAVRRGARLVVVPTRGSALSDTLGVAVAPGYAFGEHSELAPGAPSELEYRGLMEHWLIPAGPDTVLPAALQPLLLVRAVRQLRPTVAALPLGEGRILLIADAGFLVNHRFREGDEAVLATRLLEWLQPDTMQPLVFAEWHHQHGIHPDPVGVVVQALFGTAPGRAVLVLLLAGGVMLLAIGARPLPPEPAKMIQRRSPFEHVGALSRAYQQISGTRIATRHLVRGLWRRRALGARAAHSEREYLLAIRERYPQLAAETEAVLRALEHRVPSAEFVRVGEAVHTIERTLTQ
jgi:hypothetical protein